MLEVKQHTTFAAYASAELRELAKQFHQWVGETIPGWLLRLWHDGAESTELSPNEMAQLASIMVMPSLSQRLQIVQRLVGNDQDNHSLINQLMSAARMVWTDSGELPEVVSKFSTSMDLVQIIREMGIRQMVFRERYNSPDEEVFTTQMKALILTSGTQWLPF